MFIGCVYGFFYLKVFKFKSDSEPVVWLKILGYLGSLGDFNIYYEEKGAYGSLVFGVFCFWEFVGNFIFELIFTEIYLIYSGGF